METMRKISKRYYLRQIVIWLLVNLMFFGVPFGALAISGPGGYSIQGGNAAINSPGGNANATIDMLTPSAVIGWQNFDTIAGQSVTFDRGGMNFAVLNRISGGATSFNGILNGNKGLVIVSNPSGIIFGGTAFVQARSFAAVGFDINPGAFMAQGLNFDPLNFNYSGLNGDITLDGATIEVDETLALIGRNIFNKGNIVTRDRDSFVVMAAGDEVMISRVNSHVNVNVSSPGPGQNWVKNEGGLDTTAAGPAGGKTSLVLAAGDIYSTAIGGVESLRATAVYGAEFDGPINVSATAASDAVAEVDISTGDSLTIDKSITADATGDGTFDAKASIKLSSDGDIRIKNNGGSPTEVKATAHDGANNSASVEIEAKDNVILKATQRYVKVEATADTGPAGLNQADVSIKGKNVIIETGHSESTEVVKASARDADENIANVNIEADGGVLLKAGSNNQIAIVKAEAKNGSINRAGVGINAGGGVDIIANESDARVLALAYNEEDPAVLNEAKIDIKAGSLTVRSESNHDQAEIRASAWRGTTNTAEVSVETEGDVLVTTEPDESDMAGIEASAHEGVDNFAAVGIKAGGDVKVKDYKKGFVSDGDGEAYIKAVAVNSENSNTAQVDIEAGGNVVVLSKNGGIAKIEAYAGNAAHSENTANINILAEDGYVLVHAIDGYDNAEFIPSRASIEATAENANGGTNNASINIVARDITDDDCDSDLDGSVLVIGVKGGKAEIEAIAKNGGDNSASVDIDAENDVKVMALCDNQPSEALISALAENSEGEPVTVFLVDDDSDGDLDCDLDDDGVVNTATVVIATGDDVIVKAEDGGQALIMAKAKNGYSNTADVLICAEGSVEVLARDRQQQLLPPPLPLPPGLGLDFEPLNKNGQSSALIKAEAYNGYTNTASVGIGAKGEGVLVAALNGEAKIISGAYNGYRNTAETIVCTAGDVIVADMTYLGDTAEIAAETLNGYHTDAYTGVGAEGDIIVVAGIDPFSPKFGQGGMGGTAMIRAEAGSGAELIAPAILTDSVRVEFTKKDFSTANAEVEVVSKKGSVVVADFTGLGASGSAKIISEAYSGWSNTASTGVAAGAELSPSALSDQQDQFLPFLPPLPPGNVFVLALGPESDARIISHAHNGFENTADTVVCAPGLVDVYAAGRGSIAKIKSWAMYGELNKATTQVYASEVYVDVPSLRRGNGIGAWAQGSPWVHVDTEYCMTEDGSVAVTDGESTLIIDSYAKRKDCPECPPCPCEDGPPPIPPAPLAREAGEPLKPFEFEQGGCPALMQWFAGEVGLSEDQIFVMLGNADYLATDIQPCEACARLKQQADAMAGLDAAQLEAWASAVRGGMVGPITPEMIDGIRTALADNPAAMGFDDAAAEYVRILNEELGFERDDAVAVVTGNYAPDYADLGAYIGARTGM